MNIATNSHQDPPLTGLQLHWWSEIQGAGVFSILCAANSSHIPRLLHSHRPFIAIIDDDEVVCLSLADLMRSVGHRVEVFTSAETFLASSSLSLFDCIIVDIHLPRMSGLDLAQELHALGGMTPVILITGLPDRRLDDEARSAGAQCLLRKPLEATALLGSVEKCLSGNRPPG